MTLKIYAPKDHLLTWKALIAAKYSGVEIELTPEFVVGKDNLTPEFLAKNPLGKVPVLETEEGHIFESNAIARYVARLDPNTQLFGANAFENGLVEQWQDFANSEISLPLRVWLYPIFGYMENNSAATNKAKTDIRKVLGILNDFLADKTFLVGERVTLADISVSITLLKLYTTVLDAGFRKPFVNVNRWFLTCVNQTQWSEVIGEVVLCTKMAVAPKSEHEQEKEKEKEKEKPKKQEKQEKPKAKPKPKDEDVDEDLVEEDAPKKNALDLLPPSPFVLDEWKRFYSNNDGNVAMPWFWEHYDNKGWSLWFATYKFNEELDSLLRTCNLIGGMFQRLEKFVKYSFANVLIFKSTQDAATHEIVGCWLVRGTEIPEILSITDDYELYNWVKADTELPEVRQKVDEFWKWEGSFDGKVFVQGKTYK